MVTHRYFWCLLAFFPLFALGQGTVFTGAAPDYPLAKVIVKGQADGLSGFSEIKAQTETNSEGDFEFELSLNQPTRLTITINHITGAMYAQPNSSYTVFFPALPDDEVHTFGQTARVNLIFSELSKDDLNAQISEVNFLVDSFLVANAERIGSRQLGSALLRFEDELATSLSATHDRFLNRYLHFTVATTAFQLRAFTRLDLYKRFLKGADTTPHPALFDFIRAYFQRYFNRFESYYGTNQVLPALQSSTPGQSLLELMKTDDLLQNDTLRQYVAIHALMESFNDGLPRKKVVAALAHIHQNGSTPFIREAASNATKVLTQATAGFLAADFTFKNQYNEEVSLSDFRGKYVYLEFFSTWCSECPREHSVLSDIASEYREVAEVVSIAVDSESADYQTYTAKHPDYNWNILFDPTGYQSIENYKLRALPTYFLIDPEGVIIESPALTPTGGIVERLYPVLQKMRESNKFKVGE